ncbi:MAG TPA: penicillin-binding transpeptidase domain-containing protein [Thermoanaerobaculia bacterium]|jgi:cell division protein FtsI (penicillin-binding protein 3)
MNGIRRRRSRLFLLVLTLWAAIVVARLAQLQIAQGSRYRAKAQKQQERRLDIAAQRGSILDREGRELAVSVESTSVYAVPDEVEDPRGAARSLSAVLDVKPSEALDRLQSDKGFVWIRRQIEPEVAAKVRALKLRGIHLVPEPKRFYPKGHLASAVLGFVGTDNTGLAGLEHVYDKMIRGKPGELVALTDARRSLYGEAETARSRPAEAGASLVLSLDSGLQFAAERELAATIKEHRATSGSVVVMDPWNGEILAMASCPYFDPNDFQDAPPDARRNRVIADAYEPGSTFKIVTGSLALDNGLVSLDETIDTGDGSIRVANTTITEADHHRYGALTLGGIFEHSSNIGIIRVGLRLGPGRLYAGASAFGVGRSTDVDLPGENSGIFRPLSRWSALSNAEISMGQEVSLNALQLARITAAVANGGLLVHPHLVTRIVDPDGGARAVPPSEPVRVISSATADAIARILVGVVEHGTGTKAAIPGFSVAGKTGTAQKAGVGGYQAGRHVPNFAGFAPAEKPRVVAVVVVEEPQGKYYAADVAAPLFQRVVSQALGILRVAPQDQRVPATVLAEAGPRAAPPEYIGGVVPVSSRRGPPRAELAPEPTPSVRGLPASQALALFARLGVLARIQGSGFVVAQDPPAGTPIRPGAIHTLFLADTGTAPAGPARRMEETAPPPSAP